MIPIGMKFKPVKQLILTEFSEKKTTTTAQHKGKTKTINRGRSDFSLISGSL